MHSLVEEQEDSGRLISSALVVRVDWNTAVLRHHHFVLTVTMLVSSAQPLVSAEFHIHRIFNNCKYL